MVFDEYKDEYKWYVLRVAAGREQSVAKSIESYKQRSKEVDNVIKEVYVPVQAVISIKKNIKSYKSKSIFPGYVLINMLNTKKAVDTVKSISGVVGFLNSDGRPAPLSDYEFNQMTISAKEKIDKSEAEVIYEIGHQVKIVDGPFESFVGEVEHVDNARKRLRVAVAIFGQSTPVEVGLSQVVLMDNIE